jgi:hypothetical protein
MENEAAVTTPLKEFDLQPDPRVLPMLGEINIDQWRCIAELIDNSVDGFLNASRVGDPIAAPRVDVNLPAADKDGAQLVILDNGTGMTPAVLERAVSAGWSGNNPIDNLGLFGMGFNIATARLGSVTEVWTTRKGDLEWHGLQIDFDELRKQRHFKTAYLRRAKADPQTHGTMITIKKLKPEQRKWLVRLANQSSIRKRLSQSYSSMLRKNGVPVSFDLYINNKRVEGSRHCVWDESRAAQLSDLGAVSAIIPIDNKMPERPYCSHCMNWLPDADLAAPCPICSSVGSITKRSRRVTGWIGIQRYKHQTEYGLDFVRNGRKIEISNKDLFYYRNDDVDEKEYPIDDPRDEGRIVGEIHIDHCRVNYTKDRFDRTDPAWTDMMTIVRGEGPLRPEKAKQLAFGPNASPLFALFKAFRRTSPQSKTAGAYARLMIVKDNGRATEMVSLFNDGQPEYQDDSKWWELVEEADRELLYGSGGKPKPDEGGGKSGGDGSLPEGLLDDAPMPGEPPGTGTGTSAGTEEIPAPAPTPPKAPTRREIPSLSRKYFYQKSSVPWLITAFAVAENDPQLLAGAPWAMPMGDVATRNYHFLYNPNHEAFRSITLTPLDALLTQLAHLTVDVLRTSKDAPELASILSDLRGDYGGENLLDAKTISGAASAILLDIAKAIVSNCPEEDRATLFNEMSVTEQQTTMRALAAKKIKPTEVTSDGSFLQYAPAEILRGFVERHPEYCFEGKIWDEAYQTMDYGDQDITNGVKSGIMSKYLGLLSDAAWLARQDSSDIANTSREELIRATMSLRLLRPDVETS